MSRPRFGRCCQDLRQTRRGLRREEDTAMSRLFPLAVLGCWLRSASPVRAGVYNLAEPPLGPGAAPGEINPLPFRQFRIQLTEVMAIGNPFPTKGRDHYVASRSALEAKIRAGRATV